MNILSKHINDFHKGGFAGVKETRLVHDISIGGDNTTWNGIGNMVFLADAKYIPSGQTNLHSHNEIDIITVLLSGKLIHEGSLEHGKTLFPGEILVQRAGAEGFAHNGINGNLGELRLLQIWIRPEKSYEKADFKTYKISKSLQHIYGNDKEGKNRFDNVTSFHCGCLKSKETIKITQKSLIYVAQGIVAVNSKNYMEGSLIFIDHGHIEVVKNDTIIALFKNS